MPPKITAPKASQPVIEKDFATTAPENNPTYAEATVPAANVTGVRVSLTISWFLLFKYSLSLSKLAAFLGQTGGLYKIILKILFYC
jgi:hypothetical protein